MLADSLTTDWLTSVIDIPVWGCLIGAGAICTALLLISGFSRNSSPESAHWIVEEFDQLKSQLRFRDWELALTRRFLGTRELSQRLKLLIECVVPNPQLGFGAVFRLNDQLLVLEHSLGLHAETARKIAVSDSLTKNTFSQGSLAVAASLLARERGLLGLSTFERARLSTLYVLRLGTEQHPWGLLISSDLPATLPDGSANLQGWAHLTSILGEELAIQESRDQQEDELTLTREMLELRSLGDQQYRSPVHLFQEFLKRLTEKCDFERAMLILNDEEQPICQISQLRAGGPLSRELQVGWECSEDRLLKETTGTSKSAIWTAKDLAQWGVNGPFSTAIILPLRHHDWVMGQLYLTRRDGEEINEGQRKLIGWAARYLVELISRVEDRASIERQAKRDGLTQLANRMTFDIELDRAIDRVNRIEEPLSLILLDLDHFKGVNDTHGHLGGDMALKTVSRTVERSSQSMRDGDQPLVARFGGEELVVLLPGVGEAGARRIAESIREAVQRTPIAFGEIAFHVTLSAGVTTRNSESNTSRSLISAADVALYRAKANGRNRVEFMPP